MFHSKSPVVKVVLYIIIGFFSLILIISFGMPDFISRMGLDKSIVAIINGEKIHVYDWIDFKRGRKMGSIKGMEKYLFNQFINQRLTLQKLKEMGITVSDERIADYLINTYGGKNKQLDIDLFSQQLKRANMNLSDLKKNIKNYFLFNTYDKMIEQGVSFTSADIVMEQVANNSEIIIKYAYISKRDLKKRYKNMLIVTDAEIKAEMKKNRRVVKDPKSDKKRIKRLLENKKFTKAKNKLIKEINSISKSKGSFNAANALLRGKVMLSRPFKPGEPVKSQGKKAQVVYSLNRSPIFISTCMNLGINTSSKVIESAVGFYLFSPIKKNIKKGTIDSKKLSQKIDRFKMTVNRSIQQKLMRRFIENSKIIKNLKIN